MQGDASPRSADSHVRTLSHWRRTPSGQGCPRSYDGLAVERELDHVRICLLIPPASTEPGYAGGFWPAAPPAWRQLALFPRTSSETTAMDRTSTTPAPLPHRPPFASECSFRRQGCPEGLGAANAP